MSKYAQLVRESLYDKLLSYIAENRLSAGDKLPSERALCDLWGANRVTLRAALQKLADEDKVEIIHGKGNFVLQNKFVEDVKNFISYTSGWAEDGCTVHTDVIGMRQMEAHKKISTKLEIGLGKQVYELTRLRFLNEIPMFLETAYIPVEYCPGLDEFDFRHLSLYEMLEEHYGIKLVRQEHSISIAYCNAQESAYLGVSEGTAAFLSKEVTFDTSGRAVEYCISVSRADLYAISSRE